jgi:hypothetical protein
MQYTKCESIGNNAKTCNNPEIKYGNLAGGIPASHPGNDFNKWCQQLGFAGWANQVTYGNRDCTAPKGRLFGCTSYDENVWHWCDWQDGPWYNQQLDYHTCNDGQQITSITCQ